LSGTKVEAPDLAAAIRRRFAPLAGIELQPHPPVPIGEPPARPRSTHPARRGHHVHNFGDPFTRNRKSAQQTH